MYYNHLCNYEKKGSRIVPIHSISFVCLWNIYYMLGIAFRHCNNLQKIIDLISL